MILFIRILQENAYLRFCTNVSYFLIVNNWGFHPICFVICLDACMHTFSHIHIQAVSLQRLQTFQSDSIHLGDGK